MDIRFVCGIRRMGRYVLGWDATYITLGIFLRGL